MGLSGAERQARYRAKRDALADQAAGPLDLFVKDRVKRGDIATPERRRAVQYLLKTTDPDSDAELVGWIRAWLPASRAAAR